MDLRQIENIFRRIENEFTLPQYLMRITSVLASGHIRTETIDSILLEEGLNSAVAKVHFLHLLLVYLKIALEDGVLTGEEKEQINFLKMLLKIKPGDFYLHAKSELESVIHDQLSQIYTDNLVNDSEAILKTGLQEVFDLSFDQMNEYSKSLAAESLKKGGKIRNLDVFFSFNEYSQMRTGDEEYVDPD